MSTIALVSNCVAHGTLFISPVDLIRFSTYLVLCLVSYFVKPNIVFKWMHVLLFTGEGTYCVIMSRGLNYVIVSLFILSMSIAVGYNLIGLKQKFILPTFLSYVLLIDLICSNLSHLYMVLNGLAGVSVIIVISYTVYFHIHDAIFKQVIELNKYKKYTNDLLRACHSLIEDLEGNNNG